MSFAKTKERTETRTDLRRRLTEKNITPENVLTEFSKTVKDGRGLSFSLSASEYCDDVCTAKGTVCYAEVIEGLYPELGAKLLRHSMHLFKVLRVAVIKVTSMKRLDWFRFCVDGGLPAPEHFSSPRQWAVWKKQFRNLAAVAASRCPVHLPTESLRKAKIYRRIVRGLGIVVRRTCQSEASALRSRDHRAVRIGVSARPCHAEVNKQLALEFCKRIREETGESAMACPAVMYDSKCGKCTGCSDPRVKVIVYPLHS